jgi:hypothetical protein
MGSPEVKVVSPPAYTRDRAVEFEFDSLRRGDGPYLSNNPPPPPKDRSTDAKTATGEGEI